MKFEQCTRKHRRGSLAANLDRAFPDANAAPPSQRCASSKALLGTPEESKANLPQSVGREARAAAGADRRNKRGKTEAPGRAKRQERAKRKEGRSQGATRIQPSLQLQQSQWDRPRRGHFRRLRRLRLHRFSFLPHFETSTLPIDSSDQKAAAQTLGLDPLRDQFCGAGQSRFCLVDSEPCQMRRIVQNA